MRLFLVRHPTPAVAPGICYGRSDLALAEDALGSAAALRGLLPAHATWYSSPLQRCRLFAEALHVSPVFDDRLQEIHFGTWEMQAWDAIDRDLLDEWAAAGPEFAPPGGESVAALFRRVTAFIREKAAAGDEALVLVTHAGVMKACCALLLDLPDGEWQSMRFDYGSVTLIEDGELVWHNRRDASA